MKDSMRTTHRPLFLVFGAVLTTMVAVPAGARTVRYTAVVPMTAPVRAGQTVTATVRYELGDAVEDGQGAQSIQYVLGGSAFMGCGYDAPPTVSVETGVEPLRVLVSNASDWSALQTGQGPDRVQCQLTLQHAGTFTLNALPLAPTSPLPAGAISTIEITEFVSGMPLRVQLADVTSIELIEAACSVTDNGDGSATVTCGDESVIVRDGQDGLPGADGVAGADGPTGATGTTGAAGADASSCSVAENDDGTATITCPDGTRATVGSGGGCAQTGGTIWPVGMLGMLGALLLRRRRRA
jgi:MYXO-CTERM domain-containing protein